MTSTAQRIPYVDASRITEPAMRAEFERAARDGAPRPESHAIRAHVPAVFWSFANAWNDTFVNGVCDHALKELCRLYVSQAVNCNYCGNQRSLKAQAQGLVEDDVRELLEFEKSSRYDERQKAALRLAEAMTGVWIPPTPCGWPCARTWRCRRLWSWVSSSA